MTMVGISWFYCVLVLLGGGGGVDTLLFLLFVCSSTNPLLFSGFVVCFCLTSEWQTEQLIPVNQWNISAVLTDKFNYLQNYQQQKKNILIQAINFHIILLPKIINFNNQKKEKFFKHVTVETKRKGEKKRRKV